MSTLARLLWLAAAAFCLAPFADSTPCQDAESTTWTDTRHFLGANLWGNRLQDWREHGTTIECLNPRGLPLRTVHRTDAQVIRISEGDGPEFSTSAFVNLGLPPGSREGSAAGFLIGAGAGQLSSESAALIHGWRGPGAGWFVGATPDRRAFLWNLNDRSSELLWSEGERSQNESLPIDLISLEVAPHPDADGHVLLRFLWGATRHEWTLPEAEVLGNIALVSHPGEGEGEPVRHGFRGWATKGLTPTPAAFDPLGPIAAALYSAHAPNGARDVDVRFTVQCFPLGGDATIRLELPSGGAWLEAARAEVVHDGWTAHLEVEGLDLSEPAPYRLYFDSKSTDIGTPADKARAFQGTLRAYPDDEVVVAGFTGNHQISHELAGGWGASDDAFKHRWSDGVWFPHRDLTEAVLAQDPDLLFFSGDQVYEGASPTFADTKQIELDYLYKWLLWCWQWRDVLRDRPCVVIPDDHDVYQGNIWGAGGRATKDQEEGGYRHPAAWVRMVERTQTSHLPPSDDTAPVEQGIGVYFTELVWGRASFAVLEDRKFKSGCQTPDLPPSGTNRPDHFNDPEFDTAELDIEGLELLGERQERFLEAWAGRWNGHDIKLVLSQTAFAGLATHHGKNLDYLIADLDSNGWPQSGRRRAVERIRKGFAAHLCGDQHLATLAQHGLDAHRDAFWSFCVPSVANFYPRAWLPPVPGENRAPGAPAWSGDHTDGFGNLITLYAATNPEPQGVEPRHLHDRMPGFGIVRLDPIARTSRFECYTRYGPMYAGWPRTVGQLENYPAVRTWPVRQLIGLDPDTQAVRVWGADDELLYSLRPVRTPFEVRAPEGAAVRVEVVEAP
ncbi:MAG: alkaline phosphatase D family protein [Planctomycetota bacterium]|jgi:hypothetical protein